MIRFAACRDRPLRSEFIAAALIFRAFKILAIAAAAPFFAGILSSARADEPENTGTKTIAVSDLIARALGGNPALRAAGLMAESHGHEIAARAALEDPKLTLALDNYPINSFSPNKYGMTGDTIGISQKLPYPGKLSAIREASAAEHQSAVFESEQQRAMTIREVALAYLDLQLAQSKLNLLAEEAQLLRGMLTAVNERLSVGNAPLTEVVAVRLEDSNIALRKIDLQSEVRKIHSQITALVGDSSLPADWQAEPIARQKRKGIVAAPQFAIDAALQSDPELRTLNIGVTGAAKKLAVADLGYYPDFEVMAGYTIREPNNDDNGTDFVSAGVGINLPIWRSDRQDNLRAQALREQDRSHSLVAARKNLIINEINLQFETIRSAEETIDLINKTILPQIEAGFVSARASYETGQGSLTPLFDLRRSKFDQRLALLQATAAREKAITTIKYYTGELE